MKNLYAHILRYYTYILIAIIPLGTGYLTKDPFAISYINIASIIFILLIVIGLIFRVIKFSLPKHYFLSGLIIFVLSMLWAFAQTANPRDGIGLLTSRLFQPMLVGSGVWLLLNSEILKTADIIKAFFVALIVPTAISVGQMLGLTESHNATRVTSVYDWPNTYARIQAFILIISGALIFNKKLKFHYLYIAIWLVGLIALLATKSYNGVASLVIAGLFVFLISTYVSTKLKIIVGSSLALVCVLAFSNPTKFIPEWSTRIDSSQSSRLEFWLIADSVFKEKPWTGLGIKGWENQYSSLVEKYHPYWPAINWTSAQPHNLILDALMKGGIPTLFGVLAFLSTFVVIGLRLVRTRNYLGQFILASAVMLFLFGSIDDPIWSDDIMPYIFIVIAVGLYLLSREPKKT